MASLEDPQNVEEDLFLPPQSSDTYAIRSKRVLLPPRTTTGFATTNNNDPSSPTSPQPHRLVEAILVIIKGKIEAVHEFDHLKLNSQKVKLSKKMKVVDYGDSGELKGLEEGGKGGREEMVIQSARRAYNTRSTKPNFISSRLTHTSPPSQ